MIVSPEGKILQNMGSAVGAVSEEVDLKYNICAPQALEELWSEMMILSMTVSTPRHLTRHKYFTQMIFLYLTSPIERYHRSCDQHPEGESRYISFVSLTDNFYIYGGTLSG